MSPQSTPNETDPSARQSAQRHNADSLSPAARLELHRMREIEQEEENEEKNQPQTHAPDEPTQGLMRQLSKTLDIGLPDAALSAPPPGAGQGNAAKPSSQSQPAQSAAPRAQASASSTALRDLIVSYVSTAGRAAQASGTELASVIDSVLADLENGTPPEEINQNSGVAGFLRQAQARLKPLGFGVSRPSDPKVPQSRPTFDPAATAEETRRNFLAQHGGDVAAMESNPQYRKTALDFADWLNVESLVQGFGAQAASLYRGEGLLSQAQQWVSGYETGARSKGAQASLDDLNEDDLKHRDDPRTLVILPELLEFEIEQEPHVARISRNGKTVRVTQDLREVETLIPGDIKGFRRRIIHDRFGNDVEIEDLFNRQNPIEWLLGYSTFHSYIHATTIRKEGLTKAQVIDATRRRPDPNFLYIFGPREPAREGEYSLAAGYIPDEEGGEPASAAVGGAVYHMVDEEAGAVANVTSNFHFLDPGYIIRWVKEEPDGAFTIYTLGQGNGIMRDDNEWAGASLFGQLDEVIADDLGAEIQQN